MNKTIRNIGLIFLLLTCIFIPLLFLLQFDNYQPCLGLRSEDERFICLQKETYDKLNNYQNLKLEQGNKVFKVKVLGEWDHSDQMYFARIDSDYDFDPDNLKIYVNSTNLFKM